ncbi:MAG TPA: glycerophosphodiester phosphodiesterase family protein [Anaerolineales bacterium]|nr:glycerophosphodiester phosphodiesterase family protein [Anaerolineales bacterium]
MAPLSDWLVSAPLVIAHRGASAMAPENTLAAFLAAGAMGADAIEFDAKPTRDGAVIAFHDQTLARTTGAAGRPTDLDLATLQELEAGSWKSSEFEGERIPTMDMIFETLGGQVLINVELTDYRTDQRALVALVVTGIRRHRLEHRILLSSFQSSALREAHRIAPEIPRAHLLGPSWLGLRDRVPQRRAPVEAVHPHDTMLDRQRIAAIRRSGRRVHGYTVNDSERMASLWEWGIDGIVTDVPDLALQAREMTWAT